MAKKLYYVTSNSGKFQEVHQYLAKYTPEIELEQLAFDIEEIQTDDQMKIAIDKAKKAWDFVKKSIQTELLKHSWKWKKQFPWEK